MKQIQNRPKSKCQLCLKVLFGLLLFFLVILGTLYKLGYFKSTPTKITEIANKSQTDQSGRKTYTDKINGFEIKYPNDLNVKDVQLASYKVTHFETDFASTPAENYLDIVVRIYEVDKDVNLKTWIEQNSIRPLPNGQKGTIAKNILNYKTNQLSGYYFVGGIEETAKYVYFSHLDKIYEFSLHGQGTGASYKENPESEVILDQILSTFRFL